MRLPGRGGLDSERLREAFLAARRRPAHERAKFLDLACAGDPALRAQVASLLEFDGEDDLAALDRPALGVGFRMPTPEELDAPGAAVHEPRPERIGSYTIRCVLGRGAMSTVYRAEQLHTRRAVALKLLRAGASEPRLVARFEHEARVLGRLVHPGIAQIYEAGTADLGRGTQAYLAMELVEGSTLLDFAEARGSSQVERLELMALTADAVQHAHDHGIVHRDLKPDNVLVDASGRPKILDFGIASLIGADRSAPRAGSLWVGTPAYMSPEQFAADEEPLDARSDVYSLGVLSYALLSGALPYALEGADLVEVARAVRTDVPRRLGEVKRELAGDVECIVAKALSKDARARYGSAAEFAADLRRHLRHEPVLARPASTWTQLFKFTRRNPALAGAILGLIVVLAAFALTAGGLALRARAHAAQAVALSDGLLEVLTASNTRHDGRDATALEVLQLSEEGLRERLSDWPEIEARLDRTLGILYRQIGAFPRAERNLRAAFALERETNGADHPRTLDAARELLGLLALHSTDEIELDRLLAYLLESDARAFGPEGAPYLQTCYLHGLILRRRGETARAIEILQSVENAAARVQGEGAHFTQYARNFLARALNEGGARTRAQALIERTLEGQLRAQPADHRLTLLSLVTLGEVLLEGLDDLTPPERIARARALFEQAIEGRRRTLGAEHPGTLTARQNRALALYRQGDRAEALRELEEVVAIFERAHDPALFEAREARAWWAELLRRERL